MQQFAKIILLSVVLTFSNVYAAARQQVLLMVIPGCIYCAQAKNILNSHGIRYRTVIAREGAVPRLYVNGQFKGVGVDAVQTWVDQQSRQ